MPDEKQLPDFAQAIADIEAIANRLEDGDIPLEESLKDFESAIKMIRAAQESLQAAEQKVQTLLTTDDASDSEDVDAGETLSDTE